MPLAGRGRHYGRVRHLAEEVCAAVYRDGWPARVVHRLGLQGAVRVVHHRIACPRWPAGVRSLRVAFASDLHAGPTTHPSMFDDVVARIAAEEPDLLLLGGDYVFLDARRIDALADRLARLRAIPTRLGVMGNHDLWAEDRRVAGALADAGVRVLVNEHVALPPPFGHVSVCGLDEPWTGAPDARRAFDGAGDVRVLLCHAPSGLLHVGAHRFDVAICGHTHGGHVALPFGVPIVAPGPLSRRYPHGEFALDGGARLVVSRGVGSTEVPFRVFADPDVRIVTIGG